MQEIGFIGVVVILALGFYFGFVYKGGWKG